jgi:20S proteasome subunit alpha 5
MRVESVTQAVSNMALAFGDDDADAGAMVSNLGAFLIISVG